MKIEKLSSDRLQITLTFDDMNEHKIDFKKLCENQDDLNRFVSLLLIKAKEDTDFDLTSGQFVIRVLQSDDELVLTFIRVGSTEDTPTKTPVNKNTKYKLVEQKPKPAVRHNLLVSFATVSDMKFFVENIKEYMTSSSVLYRGEPYYLYLDPEPDQYSHLLVTASEFGRVYQDESLKKAVLDGHNKVLATGTDILTVMDLI